MKIEHVALWCADLERLRDFYVQYFAGVSGQKYQNQMKGFSSFFLSFDNGCRLELMHKDTISKTVEESLGLSHLAFSVGSVEEVDKLTHQLSGDGYEVISGPRLTGDGYYESLILDPEGNRIEITS